MTAQIGKQLTIDRARVRLIGSLALPWHHSRLKKRTYEQAIGSTRCVPVATECWRDCAVSSRLEEDRLYLVKSDRIACLTARSAVADRTASMCRLPGLCCEGPTHLGDFIGDIDPSVLHVHYDFARTTRNLADLALQTNISDQNHRAAAANGQRAVAADAIPAGIHREEGQTGQVRAHARDPGDLSVHRERGQEGTG